MSGGLILLSIFVVSTFGQGSEVPQENESKSIPSQLLATAFEHYSHQQQYTNENKLNDLICTECKAALTTLKTAYAEGASIEEIEGLTILVCSDLHLFPDEVCDQMVKLEGESVLYILNATQYDVETCCGFMIGHCDKKELEPWSMPIPGDKPELDDPEPVLPAANTIRVLHITDSHTDLQFEEGSSVDCGYPLCCRHKFGDPEPGEEAAGHWGSIDGSCDIPIRTLEELIKQASLQEPDLVYLTGDMPAHNVWEQTHDSNIETINATLNLVKKYMPDTPVLNCLGNHAAAPVNSFAIPAVYDAGFDMDWLYEACVEMWSSWLPEDTHGDILRGGFFTYSPFQGFRIISINMNYCDQENWWLLLDNQDPTGQLQWLMDTLGAAEEAGEKVHMLTHFHPGKSCDESWNIVFNKILTRYESTVRALFHGHSHKEFFTLIYDPEDTLRPVAVGFTGPEGSCGSGHQPAFKMYTVDANHPDATWSVIDMQTFTMNMTEANEPGGIPEFIPRYNSLEAYGTSTLTAASVDQLTLNMAVDKDLFAQYIRNKHNHLLSPPEMFNCPEEPDCHKSELCSIVNSDHHNRDACHHIETIIDGGLLD